MGNNLYIDKSVLAALRETFKPGTRVVLDHMDDPFCRIPIGGKGTVKHVDDIGTIFVAWDCGSGLGVAYGVDHCSVLPE